MPSILFVCLHNACRSRIAEAICTSLAPDSWTIASAGTQPSAEVDLKAVDILRQHRLAISTARPKGFDALPAVQWDCHVDMTCGEAPHTIPARTRLTWDLPDPLDGPMTRYEELFQELTARIRNLIQELQPCRP
ncbi:MAG: low molecular weight phosphatase family protein [Nitrospirae bacterium]|nr:low molecular weight phosphatase family protein [Nitrospirota bacterium]